MAKKKKSDPIYFTPGFKSPGKSKGQYKLLGSGPADESIDSKPLGKKSRRRRSSDIRLREQGADFLGYGSDGIGDELEASGVELLQGMQGIQDFLNQIQGKAAAQIGQILGQVYTAAWRSFAMFLDAVRRDILLSQQQTRRVRERGRDLADEQINGAMLPIGGMFGRFRPPAEAPIFREETGPAERTEFLRHPEIATGAGAVVGAGNGEEIAPTTDPTQPNIVEGFINDYCTCVRKSGTPYDAVVMCRDSTGKYWPEGSKVPGCIPRGSNTPIPFPDVIPPQPILPAPQPTLPQPPGAKEPWSGGLGPGEPFYPPPLPPTDRPTPPQPPKYPPVIECPYPPYPPQPPICPPPISEKPLPPVSKQPSGSGTKTKVVCGETISIDISTVPDGTKPSVHFGLRGSDGGVIVPEWIASLGILAVSAWKAIAGSAIELLDAAWHPAETEIRFRDAAAGRMTSCSTSRILLGILTKYLSGEIDDFIVPYRQCQRAFLQTDTPSVAEAVEAFIAGTIDEDTYRCWVRFQNQQTDNIDKLVFARQQHFTPAEALLLWRKGIFNRSHFESAVIRAGWMHTENANYIENLAEYIPPIQDLIRFMVRDTDDEQIRNKFGLDDSFTQKFGKELAKYSHWQNIPEEVVKHYWRAHWRIPSFTQLAEIFHRNRKAGTPIEDDPLFQDIKDALIQDDLLPFWIPKLLSTTFTLLTRVDIRRVYDLGQFKKEDVVKQYVRRGYSDDDAQSLADFAELQKSRRARAEPATRDYIAGHLGRAELIADLVSEGYEEDSAEKAAVWSERKRRYRVQKKCVAAIRRQFLKGLANEFEAEALLRQQIGDESQVNALLDEFRCERKAVGKEIPAGALCRMLERGVITADQYFDRLQDLGYEPMRAFEMLRDCQVGIDKKQLALAEAKAKQQAAAAKQIASDIDKKRKVSAKQLENLAAAREKSAKLAADREELRIDIAMRLAKKTGERLADTLAIVRRVSLTMIRELAIKEYQALIILDDFANSLPKDWSGDFLAEALAVARAAIESGVLESHAADTTD